MDKLVECKYKDPLNWCKLIGKDPKFWVCYLEEKS